MKISTLGGRQEITPYPCPACGHLFEQYTGTPGGGTIIDKVPQVTKGILFIMVCESCETAVARHGDMVLAMTREQEQQLSQAAWEHITQARQIVQAGKRRKPNDNR